MFLYKIGQNLQNSYFNKLFLMYAKQKPVEYSPGGFLYLLMLVVTKGHTYSNKPSMYDLLLPPGIKGLIGVLAIFKE